MQNFYLLKTCLNYKFFGFLELANYLSRNTISWLIIYAYLNSMVSNNGLKINSKC